MLRCFLILGLFAVTSFGQPYELKCKATKQPVGTHWAVSVTLKGGLERGRSLVTLKDYEGGIAIYQDADFSAPWAQTYAKNKSIENDEYYHPVKYKNHYRFELEFETTDSFEADKTDLLLPKTFDANRGTKAYLILNRINGTFGGTVPLNCQIKAQ